MRHPAINIFDNGQVGFLGLKACSATAPRHR